MGGGLQLAGHVTGDRYGYEELLTAAKMAAETFYLEGKPEGGARWLEVYGLESICRLYSGFACSME